MSTVMRITIEVLDNPDDVQARLWAEIAQTIGQLTRNSSSSVRYLVTRQIGGQVTTYGNINSESPR